MDRTNAKFSDTQWSLVLAAKEADNTAAHRALEALCECYWEPIYAYIRFQGKTPHDAEELTQDFFVRVLNKEMFENAEASKGRLRSFLLKSLKNFLVNQREKQLAQKRGGGAQHISLDFSKAERNLEVDLQSLDSPELIYERRWARQLVTSVFAELEKDHAGLDDPELFRQLKPALEGVSLDLSYSEIAGLCHKTVDAVKAAAYRLRRRFRKQLIDAVSDTLEDPAEAEDELKSLLRSMS